MGNMKSLYWQIAQIELMVNSVQFNSLWNDNMPMDFFKISERVKEGWVTDSAQSFTVSLENKRRIVINCLDNLLLALTWKSS